MLILWGLSTEHRRHDMILPLEFIIVHCHFDQACDSTSATEKREKMFVTGTNATVCKILTLKLR